MNTATAALIIFILTYTGIIFTRLPRINIDRPSAAFFGAVAMVVFGVLPFREAVEAVDYNTLALLLGMMIIIATLQLDGFFSLIAHKTIAWSGNQRNLLNVIVIVTALASAFLVNDAVVLLFTPVIIQICRSSRLDPVPYLVAEILASNAGSVMTITGNPQNMLIGMNSGIDYTEFLIRLLPVTLLSLPVIVIIVRLFFPSTFRDKISIMSDGSEYKYNYSSMRWSVPIFGLVVVLFFINRFIGFSIPLIALLGASLILIFGKIKPSKVIQKVDWVLLLFFGSLFIVVKAIEKEGLLSSLTQNTLFHPDVWGITQLHLSSLVLSQLVSNVPYTLIMLPVMKAAQSDILWLALASASTLAGNATLIGAMANLIVAESSEKEGIRIRFLKFLWPGLAVTLITLALSVAVLAVQ